MPPPNAVSNHFTHVMNKRTPSISQVMFTSINITLVWLLRNILKATTYRVLSSFSKSVQTNETLRQFLQTIQSIQVQVQKRLFIHFYKIF